MTTPPRVLEKSHNERPDVCWLHDEIDCPYWLGLILIGAVVLLGNVNVSGLSAGWAIWIAVAGVGLLLFSVPRVDRGVRATKTMWQDYRWCRRLYDQQVAHGDSLEQIKRTHGECVSRTGSRWTLVRRSVLDVLLSMFLLVEAGAFGAMFATLGVWAVGS